jgi:aryl-alcohol dehydrogenase-like predicted oxidoreductase
MTGLSVSRLGLGLAALGRPGYINLGHAADLHGDYSMAAMQAQAHAVLDAAWSAGIRYFDAARSYGRAEEFLGSWLTSRTIAPSDVVVASKWGYTYTADWRIDADKHEVKDHSHAVLVRQIAETRALLGSHLDLYQIHSATMESGVLDDRAVLEELARLKATGVKIGLSLSGPNQPETLKKAAEIQVGGSRLFGCVQATWNLLERSAGQVLQEVHAAGMGVIVKEALANGRLTARNTDASFAAKRRTLEDEAARLGTSVDGLALAAVLAQPWADIVLSGATTNVQLLSNAAAFRVRWDGPAAAKVQTLLEEPQVYWATRGGLAWN